MIVYYEYFLIIHIIAGSDGYKFWKKRNTIDIVREVS